MLGSSFGRARLSKLALSLSIAFSSLACASGAADIASPAPSPVPSESASPAAALFQEIPNLKAPPFGLICSPDQGLPTVSYGPGEPSVILAYGEQQGDATVPMIDIRMLADLFGATYQAPKSGNLHLQTKTVDVTFAYRSFDVTVNGKRVSPAGGLPELVGGIEYVDAGLGAWLAGGPDTTTFAFLKSIATGPDGKLLPVPGECPPPRPTNRSKALLAKAAMPYPERPKPTAWCDGGDALTWDAFSVASMDNDPLWDAEAVGVRAERELCNGYYGAAARDFALIKPYYVHRGPDGTRLLDFQRRYIISQLLGGSPSDAYAMLLPLGAPSPELRASWAGKNCEAIRAYVAEDATEIERSPDEHDAYLKSGPSPNLKAAAGHDCAGNVDAAIADLKAIDNNNTSLYGLMIGDLYAQKRDWSDAVATWWTASHRLSDVPQVEFYTFDNADIEALWNLYYYRSHFRPA